MKKILVTGSAGFIGMSLVLKLLKSNYEIYGIDNLNNYYDFSLKSARLKETGIILREDEESSSGNYTFYKIDINNFDKLNEIFRKHKFDIVIHLAAQAGVRYSISNPKEYINSNIFGFYNILELCKAYSIKHLVYASSSSVYGNLVSDGFDENMNVDKPLSLYASTKKSNELFAHAYSNIYGLKTTGLRFFTVYGPWGRPDMAPWLFTEAILNEKAINVFNYGELIRDFTFVDDIVSGIIGCIDSLNLSNYNIINLGASYPVGLMNFIEILESVCDKKAIINYLPMQPGDVYKTTANTLLAKKLINYQPQTDIRTGLKLWFDWYIKWKNNNL